MAKRSDLETHTAEGVTSNGVAVMDRPWEMPRVRMGMTVRWRPAPGDEAVPAIVTKVGLSAIGVLRLIDGTRTSHPIDGVRHIDDPRLKTLEQHDGGVWDYTLYDKELMAGLAQFGVRFLDNTAPDLEEE